jgi:tRNA modification GTPase
MLVFKGPKSYTTEDVIEIHAHGGMSVTQKLLQVCLTMGARHAEGGEFTRRAFLGGRIDLTQVEAVLDIISARTNLFSTAAAYNLSGKLSEYICVIRDKLIDILAHVEASVDFPDEVDEMPYSELADRLNNIKNSIHNVLEQASDGNLLKYGIRVTIVGKPNVGKSSLFNHLLKSERAIVTSIPGTTRDILQETIDIDGIPVMLVDTAGIRELLTNSDSDYIESIGVSRSRSSMVESDLILFIYDITQGIEIEDQLILEEADKACKPLLKLANKVDLLETPVIAMDGYISISATSGEGIKQLKQSIKDIVLGKGFKVNQGEIYINIRHQECLKKSLQHIDIAINATGNREMQDLISIDVKAALLALDEIVGEVIAESIIDRIFSQFCVGK